MDTAPYLIEPLVLPAAIGSPDAGEYGLLHWTDSCPEEHADQLAALMSRTSTDAPSGAQYYDAESWDVARVGHVEKTWKRAGLHSLVASARHRATGELAAYAGYRAVDRIITFNAAENDHMPSINVALGFRPAGYDGEWQKAP